MQNKKDPRGRKPIGDKPFEYQIAVRLGPAEISKLMKLREDTGLTTAAIVRAAIRALEGNEYWPDATDQENEKP